LKHVLKSNPESIYTLTSREFEEFVAYLYKRNGFNVHITPPSKDGGKDIIARYDMPTGEKITYFIECKKYNPRKKVGVHVVRALAGVMQNEQVHIGVIASTAGFTAGAKNIIIEKNYNIELKDMNDITCMLS
jgi:restriction system protein